MSRDDAELSAMFTTMARTARDLSERRYVDEDALLLSVTTSAVEQIPGADWAAITLVSKGGVTSVAPTDAVAQRVDELQRVAGVGPAISAVTDWADHVVRVDDYRTESRWPAYISAVLAHSPVKASLAFQLYRSEQSMGALSVHSSHPHKFAAESLEVGLAVATHAALALHAARREGQFASALASRDTIGQAKGMVMERFKIDALQAWELLRTLSQNDNIAVHKLCRQLIDADVRTAVKPPVA